MRRRSFLASLGAAMCLPLAARGGEASLSTQELIRPGRLRAGDTVGLITPATTVSDPDRLLLAGRTLSYFGLRPRLGKHVGRRSSDYRASVDERLDDLHAMFAAQEVKAVFAVRGGYGSPHLLDRVDYDLIRRNPKIFLGYSDLTALHLAILKRAGLVTFHGPVAVSSFTEYTQQSFRKTLFENTPAGKLTNPAEGNQLRPRHPLRAIRPGRASGRLTGGNLTMVCGTLGTPYEIETCGRILFLEDVDEEPYRIDRLLTQLRLAGKLDEAAGVIIGECENCRPRDYKPSFSLPYSLGEVLDNLLGGLQVPVLYGLTVGHTDDQLTLPLGVRATLDADAGTLELLESGVV